MKKPATLLTACLLLLLSSTFVLAQEATPSGSPNSTNSGTPRPTATPSGIPLPTQPPLATPSGTATIGGQISPSPTPEPTLTPIPSPSVFPTPTPLPTSTLPEEVVETIEADSANTTEAETPSLPEQIVRAIVPPAISNLTDAFPKEFYSSQKLSPPLTSFFLLSSAALIILGLTVLKTSY